MNRSALLIGVSILSAVGGYFVGVYNVEATIRREYEESARIRERARKIAEEHRAQKKADDHPIDGGVSRPSPVVEEDAQFVIPFDSEFSANDYHKAMAATTTDTDVFVNGGVNDYGISYIEEEEFLEEDGRFKGHITIVMEETQPSFFMDGSQISDWDQRVGDSILVDFYKLVPPGVTPVLYVRNHRTDEDYEVTREIP